MNDNISIYTLGSSEFRVQHFTICELLDRMNVEQLSDLKFIVKLSY